MAILITLHAIQAIQPHPHGDHIVCRRNGEALAPRDVPDSISEGGWSFAHIGQQQTLKRTLLVGEHGDRCTVALAALGQDGPEEPLGCVEIAIEQNSLGFSECVEAVGATRYGGREGKYHQVDIRHGWLDKQCSDAPNHERCYRLLFYVQLLTDL